MEEELKELFLKHIVPIRPNRKNPSTVNTEAELNLKLLQIEKTRYEKGLT